MTINKIKADILEARISRDSVKSNLLSTFVAEITKDNVNPTEEEIQKLARKYLKNLDQCIKMRPDDKLKQEYLIINEYFEIPTVNVTDIPAIVDKLISENPDKFESIRENIKNIGWFIGQTMKLTSGQGSPNEIKEYIERKLNV